MKKSSKILALVLCLAMLVSVMSISAFASYSSVATVDEEVSTVDFDPTTDTAADSWNIGPADDDGNWTNTVVAYYVLNDDNETYTLYILGEGPMTDFADIPANQTGAPSFTTPWFTSEDAGGGDDTITAVVVGEGVTSIGATAFWNCAAIESIKLPSTIQTVGQGAFAGCESLTKLIIPASVTSIAQDAFAYEMENTGATSKAYFHPFSIWFEGAYPFEEDIQKGVNVFEYGESYITVYYPACGEYAASWENHTIGEVTGSSDTYTTAVNALAYHIAGDGYVKLDDGTYAHQCATCDSVATHDDIAGKALVELETNTGEYSDESGTFEYVVGYATDDEDNLKPTETVNEIPDTGESEEPEETETLTVYNNMELASSLTYNFLVLKADVDDIDDYTITITKTTGDNVATTEITFVDGDTLATWDGTESFYGDYYVAAYSDFYAYEYTSTMVASVTHNGEAVEVTQGYDTVSSYLTALESYDLDAVQTMAIAALTYGAATQAYYDSAVNDNVTVLNED